MPRFKGFIRDTLNSSNSRGVNISPRPSVICLPPSRQKFKSEPSFAQSLCNSSLDKGLLKISFRAKSVPAASVLPPARLPQQEYFFL